jgi:Na+/alanine symporter
MISWSYYGERCFTWLFGEKLVDDRTSVLFLIFVFLGSQVTATQNILDFSDLMILGMAFPNILGVVYCMSAEGARARSPTTPRACVAARSTPTTSSPR